VSFNYDGRVLKITYTARDTSSRSTNIDCICSELELFKWISESQTTGAYIYVYYIIFILKYVNI
jgi:hypothetical protein